MEENYFDGTEYNYSKYQKYQKIINNAAAHYGIDIAKYFFSEYTVWKNDDPDFIENLGFCMHALGKSFRGGYNDKINAAFPNLKRLDMSRFMNLENQYMKFCQQVEGDLRIKEAIIEELNNGEASATSINVKLKFTVNSNQVYDVFKQLKEMGFINNTIDELADFISQFVQFKDGRNPGRSTIAAELKRNKRPSKGKRYTPPSSNE
jgi:hypothetical protein